MNSKTINNENLNGTSCKLAPKRVKVLILFAFMAMFGFNAMAQTETKHVLAVATDKMNVLYAGIPNPVTIAASSVSSKKIRIDWGGARATYNGNGHYNVDVPTSLAGRELIITVKKGKNQVLGSYSFRIKSVPVPNAFLGGGIWGGGHPKEVLLANPFVYARMVDGFNYHLIWEVLSYKVTFINNHIVEDSFFVEGAMFSDEVINKIKDAPLGTIIEFSEIKIISIAGKCNIERPIAIRLISEYEYTEEYKDGYNKGYEDGNKEGYKDGYKDRYEEEDEYKDGYKKGYEDGYKNGDEDRYQDGYQDGYENGYENGYRGRFGEEDD